MAPVPKGGLGGPLVRLDLNSVSNPDCDGEGVSPARLRLSTHLGSAGGVGPSGLRVGGDGQPCPWGRQAVPRKVFGQVDARCVCGGEQHSQRLFLLAAGQELLQGT